MALSGLHVLLTYTCNYACDHCFVWGSPEQAGVFTLERLEEVYRQALDAGTLREFYFEGGEAFLYYPILLKGVARAHELGFRTGIVSNGYWATAQADARAWLEPLAAAGLDEISFSQDAFHGQAEAAGSRHVGQEAARELGLDAGIIAIDPPVGQRDPRDAPPGQPLTGGGVMFRGRAAEVLTPGLPRQPWRVFTSCPYEDLANPGRVHLDPFGYLHLCQGLVMGNLFQRPLAQILAEFEPAAHPIAGPLLAGGPAQLVQQYSLPHQDGYVDACHLCYSARLLLRPRFPDVLAPDQMYGVASRLPV